MTGWPGEIQEIALDPLDNQTIYAGGSLKPGGTPTGALFKTANGGVSWTNITGTITAESVDQIELPSDHPGFVVVRAGFSLFRSIDAGSTWTDITPPEGISSVWVNPELSGEIYAAVPGGDFLLSENGGDGWTSLTAGPGIERVLSFDVVPCVKMIIAGTAGGGVVRNRLDPEYMVEIGSSTGGTTDPPPGAYGYEEGAALDISAVPASGYRFTGWTGAATGTANPLQLTVSADIVVRPEFSLVPPTPQGFSVVQREARSLFMAQVINVLTWQNAPGNPWFSGYRVYLLGDGPPVILAELSPSASTYWHRGVAKDKTYRYALAAFDATGFEGEAAIAQTGPAPGVRSLDIDTSRSTRAGVLSRRKKTGHERLE